MHTTATCNHEYTLERVLYLAIELDNKRWKLGFTVGFGQRPREHNVTARDTTGLEREIRSAKRRYNLPENCRVLSCYEAGREGFPGLPKGPPVPAPQMQAQVQASCTVSCFMPGLKTSSSTPPAWRSERSIGDRRPTALTLRLRSGQALEKMLRMLIRYHAGDEKVWSVVRVPTVEAEDRRQLHRDRWALTSERNRHINRIKGLLATQGISLPINGNLPERLNQVRKWDGSPLPPGLMSRLLREHERFQFVEQQIKTIEQEQRQALRRSDHPALRWPGH